LAADLDFAAGLAALAVAFLVVFAAVFLVVFAAAFLVFVSPAFLGSVFFLAVDLIRLFFPIEIFPSDYPLSHRISFIKNGVYRSFGESIDDPL
jgi:hypothetical protein